MLPTNANYLSPFNSAELSGMVAPLDGMFVEQVSGVGEVDPHLFDVETNAIVQGDGRPESVDIFAGFE
jgi:hypothetical protein